MFRLFLNVEYQRGWLKFSFNQFWYGILGMPSGSGYRDHDSQTNINL